MCHKRLKYLQRKGLFYAALIFLMRRQFLNIEQEVSSYYLADEIRGIYRGMMIAIPPPEWQVFEQMSLMDLTQVLQDLAGRVNLTAFVRHPRTQKETKSRLKRHRPAKRPHISTAKIFSQAQTKKHSP